MAALEAMVEHRRSRSRITNWTNQVEMVETKLEESESELATRLRAEKIADDQANAAAESDADNAGASSGAGLANDGAGDKIPVIDLTLDGGGESDKEGNNEVCFRNEQQQQEEIRPKLLIPNFPLLPRIRSPFEPSMFATFPRFHDVGTSQQVQGIKRKQPEEEREYMPFIPLLVPPERESLIPIAKEEKYGSSIFLTGLKENESSIPLTREEEYKSPTEEGEHEPLVPVAEEKGYESPILPTEGEHESLSVPLEEYESLIPFTQERVHEEEYESLIPLAEEREHESLIHLIGKNSSPGSLNYLGSKFVTSLHRRRVKTLTLCPVNDKLFVTSSLDGMVRLWEVHSHRLRVDLLSASMDCLSPRKRRLPEDIAWHPNGNSLFGVHSADGQDSQVSIMNLTGGNGEMREILVDFLENKPHAKGAIKSIAFLPMEDPNIFVTGGSDHAVVVWRENNGAGENKWIAEALHRSQHTGAVMGVCGLKHKQIVLSSGMDKRILGYDVATGEKDFMHKVDTKCLDILPNPRDFNLFVVQTGTHKRQLRLFDIRVKHKEIYDFGWRQQSSETQSGLINPSWSSNGLFITCGSVDPQISIFDIRYQGHKPFFAVEGHEKRVYKAVCLQSLPMLISTSSDHALGLHRFA